MNEYAVTVTIMLDKYVFADSEKEAIEAAKEEITDELQEISSKDILKVEVEEM